MKILVVDDEADARALMHDLLSAEGHRVTAAASAVEAMVHVQMDRYDLVLLDLMMPGIDGYEMAQFLATRWNTFDIPVVVVSCRGDAESRSWAALNGAGYLQKPFGSAELLDAVRTAVRP
jgi:DNA-binding response OmpR family regulator